MASLLTLSPLRAAETWVRQLRKGQTPSLAMDVVGDMEREHLEEGLSEWHDQQQGHIYLAVNPAAEHLYKIGRTRKSIAKRMADLNSAGVLVPWTAVCGWRVYDAPFLEAACHKACAPWWVGKECFNAPWDSLAAEMERVFTEDSRTLNAGLEVIQGAPLLVSRVNLGVPI